MPNTGTMFDQVVECYIQRFQNEDSKISEDEMKNITDAVKQNILKEVEPLLEERQKEEISRKAKNYKKKLFRQVKITMIVETIFLAFFVGLIINQVTNIIPGTYCWEVIIISLLVCVLLVVLATAEPKE